jgi:SAM-dependent methyltransferase
MTILATILIPAQRDTPELLDLGAGTAEQRAASLADLRQLNRWLGGIAASRRELAALVRRRGLSEIRLLDIGTGSADLPAALARAGERIGLRVRAFGIDLKLEHLHVARRHLERAGAPVTLACADALRLPLADGSVDVVHSALFMHHFRPPALALLLAEAWRVARHGLLMNDLVRHAVPLTFLRALAPLLSPITRHDSVASIRRAYTAGELAAIARDAGLPAPAVRCHFPYRQCLVVERST